MNIICKNSFNFLVIMVALAFLFVLKYDVFVIHYLSNPDTKSLIHLVILFFFFFAPYQNVAGGLFPFVLTIWFIIGIVQFHKKASLKNVLIALLVFVIVQLLSQGLIYLIFFSFWQWLSELSLERV